MVIGNGFDKESLNLLKSKRNIRVIDASNYLMDENFKINSINDSFLFSRKINHFFQKKILKLFQKKTK